MVHRTVCVSLVCATTLALCAPVAPAQQREVLRAAHNQVTAVGSWRIHNDRYRRTVSLRHAIHAFGQPSSRRLVSYYCRVSWRRLGIVARFTTLGGLRPGETMCTPTASVIDTMVIRGSQWRTWEGLRIGAASSAITEHHRRATFEFGRWTLARWINPGFGDVEPGTPMPMVTADVRNGRVVALRARIGAQGE
jgi:hypothetical protein